MHPNKSKRGQKRHFSNVQIHYANIFKEQHFHIISAIVLFMLLLPQTVCAQPLDTRRKVDTLSIMDRLSFRTNGTDWLLMIPNVGVEFDLRNTNWSRWAVNLNFRYRPGSDTKIRCPQVYELSEVKVEGRMYWRERQAQPTGPLAYHTMPWDKLMSCRRMVPKHANTVFYRGIYASYGTYALRLTGNGHHGKAFQTGLTWGFVRPLYTLPNGNSIDMEIGISGGIAILKDRKFAVDNTVNDYYNITKQKTHILPMVNDLHAALVYRIGKYPIQKKYRWRYDVDMDFRAKMDSLWLLRERNRSQDLYMDSLRKTMEMDFRETYDSVINKRHEERQENIDRQAPKRKKWIKVLRDPNDPRQKYLNEENYSVLPIKEEEEKQ